MDWGDTYMQLRRFGPLHDGVLGRIAFCVHMYSTLLRLLYISPAPVSPTFLPLGGWGNPEVLADSKV